MKITSQLALNQIKLNKKRTIASILAISLSTALVTAVMCFATSGNKMLTDFLGPGYGDYAGALNPPHSRRLNRHRQIWLCTS